MFMFGLLLSHWRTYRSWSAPVQLVCLTHRIRNRNSGATAFTWVRTSAGFQNPNGRYNVSGRGTLKAVIAILAQANRTETTYSRMVPSKALLAYGKQ